MGAAFFKRTAGSRPHRIVKYCTALGQQCLLGIVFRHRDMKNPFIEALDVIQNVLVEHQCFSKDLTDGLFRQIIVSRSKAAGRNQNIRSFLSDEQSFPQAVRIITYDGVPKDVDPQL